MEQYTIYCTEEQTKKAYELGVPIKTSFNRFDNDVSSICSENNRWLYAVIPTAEQMIGWLEEQGISVKASCFSWCNENKPTWQVHAYNKSIDFWDEIAFGHSKSCKEATLAAIDAALDYLSKK